LKKEETWKEINDLGENIKNYYNFMYQSEIYFKK